MIKINGEVYCCTRMAACTRDHGIMIRNSVRLETYTQMGTISLGSTIEVNEMEKANSPGRVENVSMASGRTVRSTVLAYGKE